MVTAVFSKLKQKLVPIEWGAAALQIASMLEQFYKWVRGKFWKYYEMLDRKGLVCFEETVGTNMGVKVLLMRT